MVLSHISLKKRNSFANKLLLNHLLCSVFTLLYSTAVSKLKISVWSRGMDTFSEGIIMMNWTIVLSS